MAWSPTRWTECTQRPKEGRCEDLKQSGCPHCWRGHTASCPGSAAAQLAVLGWGLSCLFQPRTEHEQNSSSPSSARIRVSGSSSSLLRPRVGVRREPEWPPLGCSCGSTLARCGLAGTPSPGQSPWALLLNGLVRQDSECYLVPTATQPGASCHS